VRLATFRHGGARRVGSVDADERRVIPIPDASGDMLALIANFGELRETLTASADGPRSTSPRCSSRRRSRARRVT
jgi:hypothetical protein